MFGFFIRIHFWYLSFFVMKHAVLVTKKITLNFMLCIQRNEIKNRLTFSKSNTEKA